MALFRSTTPVSGGRSRRRLDRCLSIAVTQFHHSRLMTVFPPLSPPTSGIPRGRGRFCLQPRMAPSTSGTGWTRIDRLGAQHHEQSEGSPGTSKMIEPCYKLLRHCSTNWCGSVKRINRLFYDQTGIWLKKQFRRKTNWWKCGTCFMRIKLIFAFKLQKNCWNEFTAVGGDCSHLGTNESRWLSGSITQHICTAVFIRW